MAGLIGMAGGAGVAPVNFNGEDDEPEPNVSESEQQLYEMFVKNGFELLYGTKEGDGPVRPDILGRLSQGASEAPQDALAQTAVWLTMMVEQSAEQSGRPIPDEIVFHGGKALFEELVEVSEAAGIHDYTEQDIQGAWYKALDMYREANTKGEDNPKGRINADVLRGQFQELNDADAVGRAGELLGMAPGQAADQAQARIESQRPPDDEGTQ